MAEDKAVSTYKDLANIPSLLSGQIHKSEGVIAVTSSWSQRDIERASTVKFNRSYMVLRDSGKKLESAQVVPIPDATEQHEELISAFSPCGEYKAVIRQAKNKKGEDQQYIEIWNKKSKSRNVNLTSVDKHGKVYNDVEFGCLSWSSKSDRLVYIAEKKQKKTAAYFDRKSSEEGSEPDKEAPVKGDQYLYRDDWGETLVDKCYPIICTFDINTEAVTVVEGLPEEVSPAKASWGPDDAGIVFSAWYHEPYKIGVIYCDNRRSAIFHLSLQDKKCTLISDDDKCCRTPQCSPDGSKIVYLQNSVGGPHKHCKQLMMFDWKTQTSSVVIDVVSRADNAESFPGLFVDNLPLKCWADDNETVYLTTIWRSNQKIISINTSTKAVTVVGESDTYPSWSFIELRGSLLLAWRVSPNTTGQLVICDISQQTPTGDLDWLVIEDNYRVFSDLSWKVVSLPRSDGLDIEGILVYPNDSVGQDKQPPLIVFPHGGPHSGFTTIFLMLPTFLCQLGYVVVLVNYRGSIGFGQDYIDSLPGKVGSQDVTDCHVMANHVLSDGFGDWDRVIITGGSHGGFLSLHMIGQYPDFYKVCAVRNPVCNIAAMVGATDIPNWCYVEAGSQFSHDTVPSSEVYQQMIERSPVSHISKVKAPTLFLIGKDDRRVPPKQGEDYYKNLRARGIKTKLLMYPENNHGLVKLDAEPDYFINMSKWFAENL